jgi:hypothetical protein
MATRPLPGSLNRFGFVERNCCGAIGMATVDAATIVAGSFGLADVVARRPRLRLFGCTLGRIARFVLAPS